MEPTKTPATKTVTAPAKAPTKAAPKLSAADRAKLRKVAGTAPRTGTKTTPKTPNPTTTGRAAKAKAAKAAIAAKAKAPKAKAPKTVAGPSPERIRLAKTVAGLRAKGAKWNEISATTGKSEPTLAKLRSDVRNGKFAAISPVKDRTPASGAGSF